MSGKSSKRVNFSPDANDKPPTLLKHGGRTRVSGKRNKIDGIFIFRMPRSSKLSPARLLRQLEAKVARVLRYLSTRRKSSSRKVSSASLTRSRSLADTIDSQRAEAIEDCIEFLNSSSSFQRSNSVSTH